MSTGYDELLALTDELTTMRGIEGLLTWDESVNMPSAAAADRGRQSAWLSGRIHELMTSDRLGDILAKVDAKDADGAANVRLLKRDRERALRVPKDLAQALTRQGSATRAAWLSARDEEDFAKFAPALAELLCLKAKWAEAVAPELEPFATLAREYEPDLDWATTEALFARLRDGLVQLLDKIRGARRQPDRTVLFRAVDPQKLEAFARDVIVAFGYDPLRGRIDHAPHPFCMGNWRGSDVRLTTRFRADQPFETFFALVHEAGHGMYEQGLPGDVRGQPISWPASLGVHESQSRFWENMVARHPAFWEGWYADLQKAVAPALDDVSCSDFTFAVNGVEPSLVRVAADEVTYNLHIMLRVELERALLSGQLSVTDLPDAWNDKMRAYLGIEPPNLRDGVLQDIHWAVGIVGYFPTYTLGNLYAASFHEAYRQDVSDFAEALRERRYDGILGWLRRRVHEEGSRQPVPELLQATTGQPISERPLLAYLEERAITMYGI